MAPAVSIVIPCYQQAHFLREALNSVVAQTYRDFEVIIVNDGSPDDTSEVALDLIARHPSIRISLLEKPNGGLADARNAGIEAERGEYILPLDADDMLHPEMLQRTVALLQANPQIAIAYTDLVHFGAVSKTVCAAEYDFLRLPVQNHMNCCSLFRRQAWAAVGGYNRNMRLGYEDWDFWIGCGERGFFGKRIPEPLLFYRVKHASMYTKAVEHDAELRSQIVLNHPRLYSTEQVTAARRLLNSTAAVSAHAETELGSVPISSESLPQPDNASSNANDTGERAATNAKSGPMVSVIVPTFNRPHMLDEALQSILDQTYQDYEIIVVNDCGDDVSALVSKLNTSGRIRYLTHERNGGLAVARNTGLRAARGKYVAYLDDDDIYLPIHVETLVGFLEETQTEVAYTDAFCRRWEASADGSTQEFAERFVPYSHDWDNDRILHENFVPVLCVMHRRACLDASGYFDESLSTHEDWEMWIRLSRRFTFSHIPRVTCEFRRSDQVKTLTNSKTADFARTTAIIYQKHRTESEGKRRVFAKQQERLFNYVYTLRKSSKKDASALTKTPALAGRFEWRQYAGYWVRRKLTRPLRNLSRKLRGKRSPSRDPKRQTPHIHTPEHRCHPDVNPAATFPAALLSSDCRRPLTIPLRATSAWAGHSALAYDLVRFSKPNVLVELGTHAGYSYFSFCHAVKDCGLQTACHAVDTWQGDEHSGYYDNRIYSAVREYNQQHFPSFSTLHRMTFDAAASEFADESIDVLHIDGLHLYEAVKHDWATWRPKVRTGGIVLFHDIGVSDREFGVWRLWEELAATYPSISFEHESGLGVLCKGALPADNPFLKTLFLGTPTERAALRCYYRAQFALDETAAGSKKRKLRDLPYQLGDWILRTFRPASFVELGANAGLLLEYMCANVPDAIGCDTNPFCQTFFHTRNPSQADRYSLMTPSGFTLRNPFDVACSVEFFQKLRDDEIRPLMAELAIKCRYFVFSSSPHANASPALDREWGHINRKQPREWDALFAGFNFERMPLDTPITPWAACYENVKLARLFPERRIVFGKLERIRYWFRNLRKKRRP